MKLRSLLLVLGLSLASVGAGLAQTQTVQTLPSSRASGNVSSTIAVTNTFQSLWNQNSVRVGCGIQNTSSTTQWVYFGPIDGATKAKSVILAPGQGLNCSTSGISATDQVSITGTAAATFFAVQDGAPMLGSVGGGGGNAATQIQGNSASDSTDVGNPVKIGGVYNSTLPTFTNGRRADLQTEFNGVLRTSQYLNSAGGANNILANVSIAANTGANSASVGFGKLAGTALTRQTVNITTATTTAIVSGTASQLVRVYKINLNFAATQTLNIISSGGTSLVGAPMTFNAGAQLVLTFDGEPWYVTTVAEGLSFVTTTTGAVTGTVYYVKAP